MKTFSFVLDDIFTKGLRPDRRGAVDSNRQEAILFKGLMPTPWGAVQQKTPTIDGNVVQATVWGRGQMFPGPFRNLELIDDTASFVNVVNGVRTVYPLASDAGANSAEHVRNPLFAASTGWTAGSGWSFGVKRASHKAGVASALIASYAGMAQTVTGARLFQVTVQVERVRSGRLTVSCDGQDLNMTTGPGTIHQDGSYTYWVYIATPGTGALRLAASSDFSGDVTMVSMRRVAVPSDYPGCPEQQIHAVDFPTAKFLFWDDGTIVCAPSINGGYPTWVSNLQVRTGCAFDDRLWLGSVQAGNWLTSPEFNAMFDMWRENNESNYDTSFSNGFGDNVLVFGPKLGGDAYNPFALELALFDVGGNSQSEFQHPAFDSLKSTINDAITDKELGFVPLPMPGAVVKQIKLGEAMVVYGTERIVAVEPDGADYKCRVISQIGTLSRGTASGNDVKHVWIDTQDVMWSMGTDLVPQWEGYQEFCETLGPYSTPTEITPPAEIPVNESLNAVINVTEAPWYTANKASALGGASLTNWFAPLPVFFEGWQSTPRPPFDPDAVAATDIDLYEWDFGDGSPVFHGFNAAHVYETPGTYTCTLTVADGNGALDSATIQVTATARTNRPVYYVDSVLGNDANVGTSPGVGAWKTADKAFAGLTSNKYVPGTQVLFNRGQTFSVTSGLVEVTHWKTNSGWLFGAYGSGAKPIIKCTGRSNENNILYVFGVGMAHCTFQDLVIDCKVDADGSRCSFLLHLAECYDLLFLRVDIKNMVQGVTMSGGSTDRIQSGLFFFGCTMKDSSDVMNFATASRVAMIDNNFDLAGNHVNYWPYLNKAVISGNTFARAAFGRLMIRIDGKVAATPSNNVYISNNTLNGWIDPIDGYPTTGYNVVGSPNYDPEHTHNGGGNRYNFYGVYFAPQDDEEQTMEYVVFERNTVTNCERFMYIGDYKDLLIRDNRFTTPSTAPDPYRFVLGTQWDHRPLKNVFIYDNYIVSQEDRQDGYTAGIFGVFHYGGPAYGGGWTVHTNVKIKNNIIVMLGAGNDRYLYFSNAADATGGQIISNGNHVYSATSSNVAQVGGDWTGGGTVYALAAWRTYASQDADTTVTGLNGYPSSPAIVQPTLPSVEQGPPIPVPSVRQTDKIMMSIDTGDFSVFFRVSDGIVGFLLTPNGLCHLLYHCPNTVRQNGELQGYAFGVPSKTWEILTDRSNMGEHGGKTVNQVSVVTEDSAGNHVGVDVLLAPNAQFTSMPLVPCNPENVGFPITHGANLRIHMTGTLNVLTKCERAVVTFQMDDRRFRRGPQGLTAIQVQQNA